MRIVRAEEIRKILDKHERAFTREFKGLDPDFSFYHRDDVIKVLMEFYLKTLDDESSTSI